MRTQVAEKFAPSTEVICISGQIAPQFETKDWLLKDNIKVGDRLRISDTNSETGQLAIRAENKMFFHPTEKFKTLNSFIPLDLIKFSKSDVGRKIEIKGKHFLSYSCGSGDTYLAVNPISTKTYTIVSVNDRSIAVDYAGKTVKASNRLSFTVNFWRKTKPQIRFK